jgi:predicted permease
MGRKKADPAIRSRLRALFRRDRLDDELAEEIGLHLELRRQALMDEGMDPREAEREARRQFGNVTRKREEAREMWGFPAFDTVVQDLRYGARLLGRSPIFTVVAVLSLAIGVAASAAVFSVADAVLLRKLPVQDPDALVTFKWLAGPEPPLDSLSGNSSQTQSESASTSFSLAAFEAIRDQGAGVADIIGFAELYRVNLGLGGQAELGSGQSVSGNFFDVLGVRPALGRSLAIDDDRPAATPVAMITHALWQRRFAGSEDVLGKRIDLNGVPFTIVGVTPRGFSGTLQVGSAPAVFIPMALQGQLERTESFGNPNFWWVLMMGRLKPAVLPDQARAALDPILKQSVMTNRPSVAAKDLPRLALQPGARGQREVRGDAQEPVGIMAAVVAIVLLVACANVANLLLARATAREREVAVRVAIGAPRRRLIRQLLTEGLLLASIASALGLVGASWLASALLPALDQGQDFAVDLGLDPRVIAFSAAITIATTVLFGLLPALRATDITLAPTLQETRRTTVGRRRRLGFAEALVAIQVGLSLLLVTGAVLLVTSMRNIERIDPGFDSSKLLLFRIDPTLNGYEGERLRSVYMSAIERLETLPAVRSATISSHTLIANSSAISGVTLPGEVPPPASGPRQPREERLIWRLTVGDRFFETLRIPFVEGRNFGPGDSPTSQSVAIVNRTFASRTFGTSSVIGRRFSLSSRPGAPVHEIVGVVADARYTSMRRAAPPTAYLSYRQSPLGAMTFEVKTAADPLTLVPAVRHAINEIDPKVPIFDVRTQEMQIRHATQRERLFARLAAILGSVVLLLSGIGLYGLLAQSVTQRTPEIGIRMALGAERRGVLWMVIRQSMALVAAGLAIGIPAAVWGTQVIQSLLFNLSPADPLTLAISILILVGVSMTAAYVPARRASLIDPVVALR